MVLRHPGRLEELLDMLGDRDLGIRGRAAATLARLAATRPERLIRVLPRLRDAMRDDCDYVRWHLVYAMGEVCFSIPVTSLPYWGELLAAVNDGCRIARMFARKSTARISAKYPSSMEALASARRPAQPTSTSAGNRTTASPVTVPDAN